MVCAELVGVDQSVCTPSHYQASPSSDSITICRQCQAQNDHHAEMPSDSKAFLALIFLHWLPLPKEVEKGNVVMFNVITASTFRASASK